MMHPLKRIRKYELKCSVKALAAFAGVVPQYIYNVESGVTGLGGRVLEALVRLGYDREELMREYEEWKRTVEKQWLQEIKR